MRAHFSASRISCESNGRRLNPTVGFSQQQQQKKQKEYIYGSDSRRPISRAATESFINRIETSREGIRRTAHAVATKATQIQNLKLARQF